MVHALNEEQRERLVINWFNSKGFVEVGRYAAAICDVRYYIDNVVGVIKFATEGFPVLLEKLKGRFLTMIIGQPDNIIEAILDAFTNGPSRPNLTYVNEIDELALNLVFQDEVVDNAYIHDIQTDALLMRDETGQWVEIASKNNQVKAWQEKYPKKKLEIKNAIKYMRSFNGYTYKPGNSDALINEAGVHRFNLWQPSLIRPVEGNCDDYLAIIRHLAEGNDDYYNYLLDWIARPLQSLEYQREALKLGIAIAFYTKPGAGKGLLQNTLNQLYGMSNCATFAQHQIDGKFTHALKDKLFLTLNEVQMVGPDAKVTADRMKEWIMDPNVVEERKGRDAATVPSYFNIIITSNRNKLVYVEKDDRRYTVFSQQQSIADPSVYARVGNDLKSPEKRQLSALYHFLLTRECEQAAPFSMPLMTPYKRILMKSSMPSAEVFCQKLETNGWEGSRYEGWILERDLMESYVSFCQSEGFSRRSDEMKIVLSQTFPDMVTGQITIQGKKVNAIRGIKLAGDGEVVPELPLFG